MIEATAAGRDAPVDEGGASTTASSTAVFRPAFFNILIFFFFFSANGGTPKLRWWNLRRRLNIHQQRRGASSARRTGLSGSPSETSTDCCCVCGRSAGTASRALCSTWPAANFKISSCPRPAPRARIDAAPIRSDLEGDSPPTDTGPVCEAMRPCRAVPSSFVARSCCSCSPSEPKLIGPGSWAVVRSPVASNNWRVWRQVRAGRPKKSVCCAALPSAVAITRRMADRDPSEARRPTLPSVVVHRRDDLRTPRERKRAGQPLSPRRRSHQCPSFSRGDFDSFLPSLRRAWTPRPAGSTESERHAPRRGAGRYGPVFLAHGRSGFWSWSVFPSDRARKVLYCARTWYRTKTVLPLFPQ
jgi:hypothetical protein